MKNATLLVLVVIGGAAAGCTDGGSQRPPEPAAPVTLSHLNPAQGSVDGGTDVLLAGRGFDAALQPAVTLGGKDVANLAVVDDQTLSLRTPAGDAVGFVDLIYRDRRTTARLARAFEYRVQVDLNRLSPARGPLAGGTEVTVLGAGFTSDTDTAVFFGARAATAVRVLDAHRLTAISPAADAPGSVDLRVTNSQGEAVATAAFTYLTEMTLASVTPAAGPLAGGTAIVLRGRGFETDAGALVLFGDRPAANVRVLGAELLAATAPAGLAEGAVDLRVLNAGNEALLAGAYAYVAGVTVTGASPAAGPLAGGTAITVTGSGFTNAADTVVQFGSQAATGVQVQSATSLTCQAPPAAVEGKVAVTVSNSVGSFTLPAAYQYVRQLALTAVSPTEGPLAGGVTAVLTGAGYSSAAALTVRFGAALATDVQVIDGATLACRVPAGALAGTVNVSVEGGGESAALAGAFRYVETVRLSSVSPASGALAGGRTATLTGRGFAGGVPTVQFGDAAAPNVAVADDATLTCTIPRGANLGAVHVRVTVAGASDTLGGGFTYVNGVTLETLAPARGPLVGGTLVVLSGTGFTAAADTVVRFGAQQALSVTVPDAETVTAVAPQGLALGRVDVELANANGGALLAQSFTYENSVRLDAVTPAAGPLAGGTPVVLSGSGFTAGAETLIFFGAMVASQLEVLDDRTMRVIVPAQTVEGAVPVRVDNRFGKATLENGWRATNGTVLTAVSPAAGPLAGGQTLTLTGAGFAAGTGAQVRVGAALATNVQVVSAAGITATVPAAATAGLVDVAVSTSAGSGTLPGGYRYVTGVTLASATPAAGSIDGGDRVLLRGSGFTAASDLAVQFAGAAATDLTVLDAGTLLVTAPAGAAGLADVTVAVTSTGASFTLSGGYTYQQVIALSDVTPASGLLSGGATATLTGRGFSSGGTPAVLFGAASALNVTVIDDQTLTVTVPPASALGAAAVQVSNTLGTASRANAWRYVTGAALTAVAPAGGGLAGGETVTLTGAGFTSLADTLVFFGDRAATVTKVLDQGTLTCTAPAAAAAGVVDVRLENGNGSATRAGAYSYASLLALAGVTPSSGAQTGGASVTVTGAGFTNAADMLVTFGGVPASALTVTSAASFTAVTPPGAVAGAADLRVTNVHGSAVLPGAYQYVPTLSVLTAAPPTGPELAAVTATVTGTGFTTDADTAVTLTDGDGVSTALAAGTGAGTFQVLSATLIALTTPNTLAAGAYDLTVANSFGSATRAGAFAATAGVAVTGVSPAAGPRAGGTSITISGAGFAAGAPSVRIGGLSASNVAVASDTQLTATTPAAFAEGRVDVSVDVAGSDGATLPGGFEYREALRLFTATPAAGPVGGGNSVVLSGQGFTSAADLTVAFGAAAATGVSVRSSGLLSCTAPAGAAGSVDVTVTSASLASSDTLAGGYSYQNTLSVTTLSPKAGPLVGGTTLSITGSGFTSNADTTLTWDGAALTVDTGPAPASGTFQVVSSTLISVVTPAHAAGAVTLALSNANGSVSVPAAFTYVTQVTLTAVTPGSGPRPGGQTVTLTGSGFTSAGDLTVKFRDSTAAGVTVASSTTLTVEVPPGDSLQAVSVSVTSASLGSTATLAGGYTYVNPVSIAALNPAAGPITGGTAVTVTGTGFTTSDDTIVAFGPVQALSVQVVDATTLIATAPPVPGGKPTIVKLTVTNGDGAGVKNDAYGYVEAVTVASVTPASGPKGGGTTVTVNGSGFTSADDLTVRFGTQSGTNLVVLSPTQLQVDTPASAVLGSVEVEVSDSLGTGRKSGAFTFVNGVTIAAVAPAVGSMYGGQTVTVTGTGFTADADTTLLFGNTAALNVTVVDANTLTATVPAVSSPGVVNVSLSNANGAAVKASGYTYDRRPVIFGLTPSTLRVGLSFDGFTSPALVLFGQGFVGSGFPTTVRIGTFHYDSMGTGTHGNVIVQNDGLLQITDTTGTGITTSGPLTVTLENLNGQATYAGLFVLGHLEEDTAAAVPAPGDPGGKSTSVIAADFNGNGYPDLFVTNADEQDVLLMNEDQAGVRVLVDRSATKLPAAPSALAGNSQHAVAGDFDLDGDIDLVVVGLGMKAVFLKNDGTGTFTDDSDALIAPRPTLDAQYIGAADTNNDGDLDLIICVRNGKNESYRWYSGKFNRTTDGGFDDLPNDNRDTRAVAFADVNGDNAIDLLFANYGAPNVLLLNNGSGKLRPPGSPAFSTAAPLDDDPTTHALALDVDGVNGPDFVLIEHGEVNRLLLNNGDGTFTLDAAGRLPNPAGALWSYRAVAADLDNDGDTDLLLCVYEDGVNLDTSNLPNQLLANDGTGFFQDSSTASIPDLTAIVPRDNTPHAVAFDIDSDGDSDLYFANGGPQTTAEDTPNYFLRNKVIP